jgi:hypothetical protein
MKDVQNEENCWWMWIHDVNMFSMKKMSIPLF